MGHVIWGQAAELVVFPTVHVPVQVGHRNVFFLYYSFHSSTNASPSTSSNPAMGTTPLPSLTTATTPGAPSGNPGGTSSDFNTQDPSAALAYAIQARVLASPALVVVMAQIGPGFALDGGEEDKALQEEYQGMMRGLRGVARIMSTWFEKASSAVQSVVNRSLSGVIRRDLRFIEGASSMLMRWVRAIQPAIDSLDRPADAQLRLRSDAHQDGMKIAQEVLDPYDVVGADDPNLDPLHEIIVRAFAAARTPTEEATRSPGPGKSFPLRSLQRDLCLHPGGA